MLYREYKHRLTKCMGAFEVAWRFRYLILSALVMIITLICVLCGITGNVSRVKCPEEIEYGSEYTIEGHAVFRRATVQFRAEGAADWSEEKPKLVGSYEVRAVSHGIYGGMRVGAVSSFRVTPKTVELSVEGDSFLYGETPQAAVSLAYRDRLEGEHFEYDWKDGDRCAVTVYAGRILNEKGADVTSCYTLVSEPREVSVLPRPLILSTDDATKVYDGEPLTSEHYELMEGTLAEGERLELSFPSLQTDAGECKNLPVCKVYAEDGTDVTQHYDVTVHSGTLKVLPRPLTVKTGSETWIYDGLSHRYDVPGSYEVSGLADGQTAFVKDAVELTGITDTQEEVGYRENVLTIGVSDADENDVTQNYEITYEYGKLRIKTEILLTVYAVRKIYDGTPLMFDEGDFHVVKPPDVTVHLDLSGLWLTDVGSIPLSALSAVPLTVTDPAGEDAKAQNRWRFVGEEEEPVLTVEPRKLEVASKSISKVNHGQSLNGWETLSPAWISYGTLAKGHTIEIEVTGVLLPRASATENTIASVKIYDASGTEVTQNYAISLRPGILQWIG